MEKANKYLLIVVQIEGGMTCAVHTSLKDANESFDEKLKNASYNIGAAIYDLEESTEFGRGDYGFYGEPIREWENSEF